MNLQRAIGHQGGIDAVLTDEARADLAREAVAIVAHHRAVALLAEARPAWEAAQAEAAAARQAADDARQERDRLNEAWRSLNWQPNRATNDVTPGEAAARDKARADWQAATNEAARLQGEARQAADRAGALGRLVAGLESLAMPDLDTLAILAGALSG